MTNSNCIGFAGRKQKLDLNILLPMIDWSFSDVKDLQVEAWEDKNESGL